MVFGKFTKSNGSRIFFRKPKFYGTDGVTCREFVGLKVEEELIIDPDLLKF